MCVYVSPLGQKKTREALVETAVKPEGNKTSEAAEQTNEKKKGDKKKEDPTEEMEFQVRGVCVSLCVSSSWRHLLTSVCL